MITGYGHTKIALKKISIELNKKIEGIFTTKKKLEIRPQFTLHVTVTLWLTDVYAPNMSDFFVVLV